MSADKDKIEKVVRTIAEARTMGVTVLPPDINESEIDFSVVYEPSPEHQGGQAGSTRLLGRHDQRRRRGPRSASASAA